MPADYINKLARMFQDIKVSEDLNQAFKDVYRTRSTMAGELCQCSGHLRSSLDDSSYRLNFDPGKKNEIYHHS